MRITAIKFQKRGDRVNLYIDGERSTSVALEVALAAGLRTGREIDENALEALQAHDEVWKARESALRLLGHRPRSTRELRDRLSARGYSRDAIEAAILRIREGGLIDDAAFAREFVRQRVRNRPSGRRRLLSDLRAKGIDDQEARRVVDAALEEEGTSEIELAMRAYRKFRRRTGEPALATRRRMRDFLGRRGFSTSIILQVVRQHERTAGTE